MILTPIQKLANNVGDLGKIIVATSFEWLPEVQKKSPNLVTLVLTMSISWGGDLHNTIGLNKFMVVGVSCLGYEFFTSKNCTST